MPVSQAMTASVGEKRKRLDGKVFEEPPVIPCTAEELNHVLDKWIGVGLLGCSPCLDHLLKKKERTPYFAESITMLSIPLKIVGLSEGFFTRNLGRGP